MQRYSAFILVACAFALLTTERVEAAPVIWDFVATGCTSNQQFANSLFVEGCDPRQTYPVVLATLTLTGPDSSGSAIFNGGFGPAIYTGDSFALDFSLNYQSITPAFVQNPTPFGECEVPHQICSFDLSWSESVGQLDAISIAVNAFNDAFGGLPGKPFGLAGGDVASDNVYIGAGGAFAGCVVATCTLSGFWTNASLVTAPEPGSLALLASAFGIWGLTGRRRVIACNMIE
jgi:hypothetical protein